jgi:hypothetical protein
MVRVTIWQIGPADTTICRCLVVWQGGGGHISGAFEAVSDTQARSLKIPLQKQSPGRNCDFLKKAC